MTCITCHTRHRNAPPSCPMNWIAISATAGANCQRHMQALATDAKATGANCQRHMQALATDAKATLTMRDVSACVQEPRVAKAMCEDIALLASSHLIMNSCWNKHMGAEVGLCRISKVCAQHQAPSFAHLSALAALSSWHDWLCTVSVQPNACV